RRTGRGWQAAIRWGDRRRGIEEVIHLRGELRGGIAPRHRITGDGANGCNGEGLIEYARDREIPAVEGPAMGPRITHSTKPHPEGRAAAADRIVVLDRRGAPNRGHRHQPRRSTVVVKSK